jgi:hypothetical protein
MTAAATGRDTGSTSCPGSGPTFSRLSPPLVDLCRFIAFSALRDQLGQVRSFVRYLKPEFLDEVSESYVLEDD